MVEPQTFDDGTWPEGFYTPAWKWDGGFFELRLVFEERRGDDLQIAVANLWQHPTLWGCVQERYLEPAQQVRVPPGVAAHDLDHPWHGIAGLPNAALVPCATFVSQLGGSLPELSLSVPMGASGIAYPVGAYPFDDGASLAWRGTVSNWLAEIGQAVFAAQRFRFGLIDHDATLDGADTAAIVAVPETRSEGYLWPDGDQLRWHAQDQGAPPVV